MNDYAVCTWCTTSCLILQVRNLITVTVLDFWEYIFFSHDIVEVDYRRILLACEEPSNQPCFTYRVCIPFLKRFKGGKGTFPLKWQSIMCQNGNWVLIVSIKSFSIITGGATGYSCAQTTASSSAATFIISPNNVKTSCEHLITVTYIKPTSEAAK